MSLVDKAKFIDSLQNTKDTMDAIGMSVETLVLSNALFRDVSQWCESGKILGVRIRFRKISPNRPLVVLVNKQ